MPISETQSKVRHSCSKGNYLALYIFAQGRTSEPAPSALGSLCVPLLHRVVGQFLEAEAQVRLAAVVQEEFFAPLLDFSDKLKRA